MRDDINPVGNLTHLPYVTDGECFIITVQLHTNRKLDKYMGYLLITALLPITRLLGIVLRRNHQLAQAPRQILFIKLLGLGSLIVAAEPIQAMRRRLPHTKFILLTDRNIANGMAPLQVFDEIWAIDTSSFPSTVKDAVRFLIRSWKLKQLWVADLEVYSKLTTVYALLTMAVNRFGFFLSPVFFRKYLNTHNIPFDRLVFLEDNYYRMMECITNSDALPVPASHQRKEEKNKQYILMNNTCSDLALTRKLPNHTFAEICIWLLEHTSYNLAFMGAERDRDSIEQFIQEHSELYAHKHKLLNMAGVFDFESYYQFISNKGVCMVTIDSAPLHIARKLGVPTISVWGPTHPLNHLKIKAGEEKRHLYQYAALPCSPCVHRFEKPPCGGNNFCMKHITAAAVVEQIGSVLKQLEKVE